jgi:starch phosphorylase
VPAGNETTSRHDFEQVMPHLRTQFGMDTDSVMALGRLDPNNPDEPLGVTAMAIRMSRSTNGVSRIHGEVSRRMWQPIFPGRSVDQVPIRHVTNGAHRLSWTAPSMRRLLDQYLPPRWHAPERITDPATWAAIDHIPDEALWAVRRTLSQRLVGWVRSKTVTDRLGRGDTMEYVTKAAAAFDPDVLTLGFARRVATYKRLHLLIMDPERFLRLLVGPRPVQLLYAGKAHPRDDDAKRLIVQMFGLKSDPRTGGRVAFIEDYDMGLATILTAGCDVWLNLPRPPLEASGTSGIKAAFSGTLNLSVLDGWWAEAFDGTNGWGIDGTEDHNAEAKDHRDAAALFELLEREVIPMYYERDAQGIPRAWVARIKASLRTIGPRFSAARMVDEYANEIYTTS